MLYNNVIRNKNSADTGIGIVDNSTGTIIKNNAIHSLNRCLWIEDGSQTSLVSDYNCLYTTGSNIGRWRGSYEGNEGLGESYGKYIPCGTL